MSSPTIERLIDLKLYHTNRIKLILGKALDELNLIITTKILKKIKNLYTQSNILKNNNRKDRRNKQWQRIRNKINKKHSKKSITRI